MLLRHSDCDSPSGFRRHELLREELVEYALRVAVLSKFTFFQEGDYGFGKAYREFKVVGVLVKERILD